MRAQFLLPIFTILITLCYSCSSNESIFRKIASRSCKENIVAEILAKYPEANIEGDQAKFLIDFDCSESKKISSIDRPYIDVEEKFNKLASSLEYGGNFSKQYYNTLLPYCRKNNPWFGSFCMGGDVSSAALISRDRNLLEKLPESVEVLGKAIETSGDEEKVDFVKKLYKVFPGDSDEAKYNRTIMGSFLGLDDNGVQTSRLMANLLYEGRYKEYVRLLPYLTPIPLELSDEINDKVGKDLILISYATRVGQGRSSNLQKVRKTYKAWAATYLGCVMGAKGHGKNLLTLGSFLMGYAYEMLKLRPSLKKSCTELMSSILNSHNNGVKVGKMMGQGMSYGYNNCK